MSVEQGRRLIEPDGFAKALETRGHAAAGNSVTMYEQQLKIGIEEKEDRTIHIPTKLEIAKSRDIFGRKPPTSDYFPGGKLSIYIEDYTWWRKRRLHQVQVLRGPHGQAADRRGPVPLQPARVAAER